MCCSITKSSEATWQIRRIYVATFGIPLQNSFTIPLKKVLLFWISKELHKWMFINTNK